MNLSEIFQRFEGLGNNCEFGIVQMAAGYIAPGLFRNCGFGSTNQIITAIESGFERMFEDGWFSFTKPDGWPDLALDCHKYGFRFHTGLLSSEHQSDAELEKRIVAFRFMKAKLLDELRLGEKIFVYRHNKDFDDKLATRLLEAIRLHGSGVLLYVREDKRPEQRFAWVGGTNLDGLLYGGIPHLSAENPPIINFAAWEKIALGALRLSNPHEGDSGATVGGSAHDAGNVVPEPPPGAGAVIEHRNFARNPCFHFAMPALPLQTYTATAWIWIPRGFFGSGISLAMLGFPTQGFTGCMMHLRDQWQEISVTARVPEKHRQIAPALSVSLDAAGVLYTAGWRMRPEGREDAASSRSVSAAPGSVGRESAPATLCYRFNTGGLNNQKLVLFGLFESARSSGAAIALPSICLFDQGEDVARKRGATIPYKSAKLENYFLLGPLRDFAARHGISICEQSAPADSLGWEFFGVAGGAIARAKADNQLSADSFACDFFRSLVSVERDSSELATTIQELDRRRITTVVQCRIEEDWQLHTSINLNVVAAGEDHNPTIAEIITKVKDTLPLDAYEHGIMIACDEAWLPDKKEVLRRLVQRETGIQIYWKSDFLPEVSMKNEPILLAMLDFEIAVHADVFVGLSRSTFSNLVSLERFARTGREVDSHYIYNLPGPRLGKRTDNGAYCWAEGASRGGHV